MGTDEFCLFTTGRDGHVHAVRPATPICPNEYYASACGWGYGATQQVFPMVDCSVVTCPECIAILGAEALKVGSAPTLQVGEPAVRPTINTLVTMTGEINRANGWYDDEEQALSPDHPLAQIAALYHIAQRLAWVIEAIRKPDKPESSFLREWITDLKIEAQIVHFDGLDAQATRYLEQVNEDDGSHVHGSKTSAIAREMLKITEAVEAIEAILKGDIPNFGEEVADQQIRGFDSIFIHNHDHPDQPIDLEAAILAKLEKNRARGYRHGGKQA